MWSFQGLLKLWLGKKELKMEILLYGLGIFAVVGILYLIVVVSYVFVHYEIYKKPFFPFNHPQLIWERDNMAIIKNERDIASLPEGMRETFQRLYKRDFFYCGYVAFKKDQIPEAWHGSFKPPGLELLEIHGGITWAEVIVEEKEKEIIKETQELRNLLGEVYENKKKEKLGEFPSTSMKYFEDRQKIVDLYDEQRKMAGYVWVVFGFDCNHYNDEENENLGDLNHLILLTKQMNDQLLEFAKVWNLYMATENDEDRCIILDSVRNKAAIRTEMGLGGMLSMLMGKI